MKILETDIKNKNLQSCYLLYGGESFVRETWVTRFKKVVSGPFEDMNIDVFDGAADMNAVMDASQTLPFMSDKRLIIIKDSGLFKSGRKNDSEKAAQMLKDIPESTCVIFVEEEADKRLALFKAVMKNGHAALCTPPQGAELYSWAEKQTKKRGIKMERNQTLYFFSVVGEGFENARAEISKLINYKDYGTIITNEDIDAICIKSTENKVFDLVDEIGRRNTENALKIYRGLLLYKEEPVKILAMIVRQFRLMLQVGIFTAQGKSPAEIAKLLEQRDFVIKKCIQQSRNFTADILKKALKESLDTDYSIKSGQMAPDIAVELLIVKYSR